MSVVKVGRGQPRTLFAPGGRGEQLDLRMRYAAGVKGTKVGFVYEHSGHFEEVSHIRRQADRDAAEVRALAAQYGTTQAIGFSRGARAIAGALAEDGELFERIALVIPPGNLRTPQKYELWLESLSPGVPATAADILVVGQQRDREHPVDIAEAWARQLGARLEILPPRAMTDEAHVVGLLADFFDGEDARPPR